MRRAADRLRGARVSLLQLMIISGLAAVVSALIVVSALGETAPERAVIAALRTAQVIKAAEPAATAPGAASPATPVSAAASDPGASGGSAGGGSGNGSAGNAAASSDSGSSGSSDSGSGSGSTGDSSTTSTTSTTSSSTPAPKSKVKHLFVIALTTPSYATAFGHGSAATYLNTTLRPKGELLSGYRTLRGSALPDLVAMVSGQAPNADTTSGCTTYRDFHAGAAPAADGLVPGAGCVYPTTALTIGDQLDGADLPWRAYIGGMTGPCVHPNSGAVDASATGDYATARNPFVYFHSLLDLGDCQHDDLPYEKLAGALATPSRTPSYAFISPDPCDAGAASCPAGQPTGIAAADAFLRQAVPAILHSAAYRASGALMIVFSAAPAGSGAVSGTVTSPSSTTTSTSSTSTTTTTTTSSATATASTSAAGGPVRTGALVISPFTKAGSTDATSYDPYAVLRTAEDVFGLTTLARAKTAHGFDAAVFSHS